VAPIPVIPPPGIAIIVSPPTISGRVVGPVGIIEGVPVEIVVMLVVVAGIWLLLSILLLSS